MAQKYGCSLKTIQRKIDRYNIENQEKHLEKSLF
ncbi:hypothetical protein CCAN2_1440002 [Capnocytophaga canimorsus]|nr:hypothetical protein CCAN2_1440002 [Capnocytophaga canimorsus]